MDLFTVVRLISERRGWILSNDGFVRQLVPLALFSAFGAIPVLLFRGKLLGKLVDMMYI